MKLLREIENFDKSSIEEKEEGKNIKFIAPFMTADSKNKNNRRYPFEVLDTAIKQFSSKVEMGKGFGADYHPASGNLEIGDISHIIKKVYLKDKVATIEGEILGGEKGKKILQIIKSGGVLGVSARGFGETKKAKDGVMEIQKGYQMVGIDFVVNPSENVATINKSSIFESAPILEKKFFSLRQSLENAIRNKFGKRAYIQDYSDAEVIYRIYMNGGEIDAEGEDVYYKIGYKISGDEVELVGDAKKVEKQITYEMSEDEAYQLYLNEACFSGYKGSFKDYKKSLQKID